jgi:hypothetical protein
MPAGAFSLVMIVVSRLTLDRAIEKTFEQRTGHNEERDRDFTINKRHTTDAAVGGRGRGYFELLKYTAVAWERRDTWSLSYTLAR